MEKFQHNVRIRPDPPIPSDNSDFFEFQTYLKMLTSPLGLDSDIFDFENILMAEDPHGLTFIKDYLGTFTLQRGKLSAFLFLF